MTALSFLTLSDWLVFGSLFILSIVYAGLLQLWWRRYPQSYDSLTWFQVVVGVGYVLIGLGFILPVEYWIRVCAAFFFACLAIVFRSIFIHSQNQRDAEGVSPKETPSNVKRNGRSA